MKSYLDHEPFDKFYKIEYTYTINMIKSPDWEKQDTKDNQPDFSQIFEEREKRNTVWKKADELSELTTYEINEGCTPAHYLRPEKKFTLRKGTHFSLRRASQDPPAHFVLQTDEGPTLEISAPELLPIKEISGAK